VTVVLVKMKFEQFNCCFSHTWMGH